MSNHTQISPKAAHAELQTRRAKCQEKEQSYKSIATEIGAQLPGMELAHSILEKRYLTDEVSLPQVTASKNEIEVKRAELAEAERLANLATEATLEIDAQIQQAAKSIAAAQREFCAARRNESISKIKSDAALRKNLIAAMVANVGTGGIYTFNVATFAAQFINQLLPEIPESEVRVELEKFKKTNGLQD